MSYLSRRDLEDLRPSISRIVTKVVGAPDPDVETLVENSLYKGYDRDKAMGKLSRYLDAKKASRIHDKLDSLLEEYRSKPKKRSHGEEDHRETKRAKSRDRQEDGAAPAATKPDNLSSNQIKEMMANAQREIEERKRRLEAARAAIPDGLPPVAPLITRNTPLIDAEKAKKIAALQEQIRAKLGTVAPAALPSVAPIVPIVQTKPAPLILDAEGRTVDQSGREIEVPTLVPTLKANIRAKKKEANKSHAAIEKERDEMPGAAFHDDRLVVKPAARGKRALRFHEPGKFQVMGEKLRMKAQLERLQNEISQIARKTGISSATKLALIAPKTDSGQDEVPDMEWWDSVILNKDLDTLVAGKVSVREAAVTNLIEHPTQMRPPNDPSRPVYLPVFLTKKERKKLRRQNRREAWKEEQEKIRLGLVEPPEPKLRISNLMRVLGTEAVQDPTKIEAHVREQMAKRQKAHEDANNARKLTAEQKRDKKIRKIKEDVSSGVHVSVYRIRDLHCSMSKKFKVETNAKQLLMTGIVVLFKDCCVVVVEGGPKQQKRYRRLMLHRIKWEEDVVKDADGKEVPNQCCLVWEGISAKRNFGEIKFKTMATEKLARELFQKHHVEQYWDLAYSGAVLEASEDV